jgi:genome maintenance exonuclease 1
MGPAKAQEITTEAAGRGTSMHSILEHHIKEEKKEIGSNLVHVKASKMANVIIKNGLLNLTECWGTEIPVYFPKIYAGTTDGAGLWKNSPAIFDFKQTNKHKRREWIDDYFLQLCAYSEAHNELHGTNIKTGVILMCTVDLEYQEFILAGEEFEKYRCQWWKRVELFYNLP